MTKEELEQLGDSAAQFVEELAERHDILEVRLELKAIKTEGEEFEVVASYFAKLNKDTLDRVKHEAVDKSNRIKDLL